MQPLISPIDKNLLKKELNENTFLRYTNKGNNELYLINKDNAPNVLLEIGRLREITFRAAGGGTGKALDLDEYDTGKFFYSQLIVWDPEDEEIIAGYRFIRGSDAFDKAANAYHLATMHLFAFSQGFEKDFLPYTIELGRSFVRPDYQSEGRKGLFSLDNLWDGLGALTIKFSEIKYLFGKVTMYTSFNREARDGILWFLGHYFPDRGQLMRPHEALTLHQFPAQLASEIGSMTYKDGHRILNRYVRERDENIPPLVNSYMNLSATMQSFGTSFNTTFGDVEETAILVTIADIFPEKKSRHLDTYSRDKTPRAKS